jgi:hypothetical protein
MPCYQNAGQNHNIKVGNKSLENLVTLKYLGMMVTNQNYIHDKLRAGYKSGPTCEHSNDPLGSIKGRKFLDWLSIQLTSQEGQLFYQSFTHNYRMTKLVRLYVSANSDCRLQACMQEAILMQHYRCW